MKLLSDDSSLTGPSCGRSPRTSFHVSFSSSTSRSRSSVSRDGETWPFSMFLMVRSESPARLDTSPRVRCVDSFAAAAEPKNAETDREAGTIAAPAPAPSPGPRRRPQRDGAALCARSNRNRWCATRLPSSHPSTAPGSDAPSVEAAPAPTAVHGPRCHRHRALQFPSRTTIGQQLRSAWAVLTTARSIKRSRFQTARCQQGVCVHSFPVGMQ